VDGRGLIDSFKEPDRRYAIYQIIHGGIADPALADRFDRCGFGGVVGNIPYNYSFPDDEDCWKKTEDGFREYIRRGMHTWIYDEKGYPSGTGGGYVTEHNPEFIAKGLYCFDYWRVIGGPSVYRADVPGDRLWKAVLIPVEGGDPIDVTHFQNENGVLYVEVPNGRFYLFMMSIRRLFDGTHASDSYSEPRNYISMSDKKATQAFIDCTHEKYKAILGDEFGKGILATFTDEPSLIAWNIRTGVFPILPWLDSYPEEFEAKYGYPFVNACVAVVLSKGNDVVKRRCDFWEFIADSVADGFFAGIQDWCHQNGLKSSGHMLEEECLQRHIVNYGSFFRSMRRFDWPGIDQLATETRDLMFDGQIPIARFVSSFADLNGEHEVFTEFSDHSVRERGDKAGIDCYYGSVNWHLAMGVNNFTSYYSWDGITEEEQLRLNRYVSRSGALLRQGKRDSRVAVLYPEAAMWAAYTPTTKERAHDFSDAIVSVEFSFIRSSWGLLKHQVDYDYIDSSILCECEVRDGKLTWGDREYSAVVLPCCRVFEDAALEKLFELKNAGVDLFFVEEMPAFSRNTGLPFDAELVASLGKAIPKDSFCDYLDGALTRRHLSLKLEEPNKDILSHCRVTEEGHRVFYLANMGDVPVSTGFTLYGDFSKLYLADPMGGEVRELSANAIDGGCELRVDLECGRGCFFIGL